MGLGKTPTTLAHLVGHMGDRPSLVMCPLSVVHNWEAEAAAFAPKLRVLIAHGASRKRGAAFAEQLDDVDLVITTYGTVSRDIEAMSEHRGTSWCATRRRPSRTTAPRRRVRFERSTPVSSSP